MGRFEGFYTGEDATVDDGGFSGSEVFAQRRLKKEREQAKAKQLEQWENELQQCSNRKTLKRYIEKYKSIPENPYVRNASEKLDEMDFIEWKGNENGLNQYITTHPNGKHVAEAKNLISQICRNTWYQDTAKADRKEKVETVFGIVAVSIVVIVFCLVFFGAEATFIEAAGAALGAGFPIAGIYNFFIKPFFD